MVSGRLLQPTTRTSRVPAGGAGSWESGGGDNTTRALTRCQSGRGLRGDIQGSQGKGLRQQDWGQELTICMSCCWVGEKDRAKEEAEDSSLESERSKKMGLLGW